eukprot:748195-Hanusia_phi.AAC.7
MAMKRCRYESVCMGKAALKSPPGDSPCRFVQKGERREAEHVPCSLETQRMAPTTYTTPKILLPLVNSESCLIGPSDTDSDVQVPIIEYTLELLVQAGVKELFIVARS